MSRRVSGRLRRLKRDYQLKVVLPVSLILIAAKTIQCLMIAKLPKSKR